jgi:lipopolysaccharide/colanic/teichoic acid biosynthesis glycosyltransferase
MQSAPDTDLVLTDCPSAAITVGGLHRVIEYLVAAVGLLLLSPLLVLISIAIKLDDGGPVFYTQERVGRNFGRFRICKFRSMRIGADRERWLSVRHDARLTRVGRVLRHYKLDEIPQLFNVIKGDMQLVGARPELPRYVKLFQSQYALILRDYPGITDPASLAYRREEQILCEDHAEQVYVGEILPEKLRLSIEYQQRRTLWSDLVVLLRTVFPLT